MLMANKNHVALILTNVKHWNEWRKQHPKVKPDLRGVDLGKADLSMADLHGADLRKSDMRNAKLFGANLVSTRFGGANLNRANLGMADCAGADFSRADLGEVDFSDAYLGAVNFTRAHLRNANVSSSTMSRTKLIDIDLSRVRGLKKVRHKAPSSIGIDTIYRSHGQIPSEFLRGAGVPENFIEYMNSLTGTAFEYYSCFISYSSKDQDFAERLYADLQTNGVRCWFAPHHVQSGKKLHEQIDAAIRLHERLLLILSPDSINSEWVKTEIAKARQREVKEERRVLFPVKIGISFEQLKDWECFDPDTGKDLAREIRGYYIPDFSNWKSHDLYQEEFAKLLRDLKKADESRAVGV